MKKEIILLLAILLISTIWAESKLPNIGIAPVRTNYIQPSNPGSFARGTTGYLLDLQGDIAATFDTDIPGTFTTLGPNTSSIFAGDYDAVNTAYWWGIDYSDSYLYQIDAATGALTQMVLVTGITAGQSFSGMACDKNTGIMYVSSTDVTASDVYTIDLTTGVLTLIGTTGIAGLIEIAIDGASGMYGWCIVNDSSYSIDLTTGVSTLLGPLGYNLNYAQGGNFDPDENIIYLAAYSGGGKLLILDKTTGAAYYVGDFQSGHECDAMAFPGTPSYFGDDVGVTDVIAPVTGVLTATETVTVQIYNFGANPQTNIPVSFTFNSITYNDVYPGPLATGAFATHTFSTLIDCSTPGLYSLDAWTALPGDQDPTNDSYTHNFECFASPDCTWEIWLYDTYGDGWNGGTLDVLANGNIMLDDITIPPGGSGPDVFTFGIFDGGTVSTVFTAGGWPEENWYEIYDNVGTLIITSGPVGGGPPDVLIDPAVCATPPTCPDPTNLFTDAIFHNSANLNWTPGATEPNWNIEFGPAGFTPTGIPTYANIGNPFTVSGLTASTSYDWYVQADCDGTGFSVDESDWVGTTFTTLCDPITVFPALEDFELFTVASNATGYTNCWSTSPENTSSLFRWNVDDGGTPSGSTGPLVDHTSGTSTGNYLFTEASSGSEFDEAYVYSPIYDLSSLTTPQVDFWYHMFGSEIGELHLDIDAGAGWVNDIMTALVGQQQTAQGDDWLPAVVSLSAYSGLTVKFRFRGIRGDGFRGDMAMDDVTVQEAPSCPAPTSPYTDNITDTSADLNWTAGGTEPNWNIEFGPAGFTPTGTPTYANIGNPFPVSGLTAVTTYDWYVQADCDGGPLRDESTWVGPATFTTTMTPGTCGLWQICLYDTYGDGWNGGVVDVYVNGVPALYTGLTVASGHGPECHYIPVDVGDIVSCDYTAGGWAYENEYYILDETGTEIHREGAGGAVPGDIGDYTIPTGLTACPPPPPPADVIITVDLGANEVVISWTYVPGLKYYVYSDTDPYGTFTTLVQGDILAGTWTITPIPAADKEFYVVTCDFVTREISRENTILPQNEIPKPQKSK